MVAADNATTRRLPEKKYLPSGPIILIKRLLQIDETDASGHTLRRPLTKFEYRVRPLPTNRSLIRRLSSGVASGDTF